MPTQKEIELERTTRLMGCRTGLHELLAELNPNNLKVINDQTEARVVAQTLLDRKTKEMLMLVACLVQKDDISNLQVRMRSASGAGATPEEVMELLNMVGQWTGSVAKGRGIEAWRLTFRPDIPPTNRIIERS